jgi:hypothetical protein
VSRGRPDSAGLGGGTGWVAAGLNRREDLRSDGWWCGRPGGAPCGGLSGQHGRYG